MRLQATIFSFAILLSACSKKPVEESSNAGAAGQKKSSSALPQNLSAGDEEAGPKKEGKSGAREERPRKPPAGTAAQGQPGKVLSPFSKALVDVKGRKAGELVQDPNFPDDASKQFAVPEGVEEETKTYPVGNTVPGRPGYVISPYNNKIIDVQGIPAGKIVADPTYPASEKKYFRTPADQPESTPDAPVGGGAEDGE